MRNMGLAVAVAASIASSGCVQTRQYADVQFAPPSGDYKLLVLRPDVTVGSLTTGGMVEPRADWTEQARASITAALRAQQASRGGNVTIIEHRNQLPGVPEQELADVERLNFVVFLKKDITPISDTTRTAATHGSPYDYDRRVPMLFWRPGFRRVAVERPVETTDIMPTLAATIGLPIAPGSVDGQCLADVPDTPCPR